ncbi:MAG TPA: NAD-dependent dehydratase, partial [Xanthobacteraceae bacterium]|nr:NAD-dependent dehydratase [Xanthobacteraceae bacterium]
GRIGERYILGGENVLLGDMLAEVARMVGRKPPRLKFPRRAIMPIAYMAETYANFSGREPFVTLDGLRLAKYRMFFQTDKANRELGFTARPYQQGLIDAIDWFGKAGYLKASHGK